MKPTTNSLRQDTDAEIRQGQTVGELVIRHPQLRPRLEQLGIDYCCGGKNPLAEAVKGAGLTWSTVLAMLQTELCGRQNAAETDWSAVTLTMLADHILETHHVFMKKQLPRLDDLLGKVQKAHGARHGDMLQNVRSVFDSLRLEFDPHLAKEEQTLFPAIKRIDAFMSATGPRPVVHRGSMAQTIRQMEHEHENLGQTLVELRRRTGGYCLPADACPSFTALYDGLKAMEADLHEHIHLENNILFPESLKQEAFMIEKGTKRGQPEKLGQVKTVLGKQEESTP